MTGVRSSLRDHALPGALDRSRVMVAISPLATVGLLTFDSVQVRSHLGTPAALRRAVRSRLNYRDLAALDVLVRADAPACLVGKSVASPDSIAGVVCGSPVAEQRFDTALESLTAMAPDAVLRALGARAPGEAERRMPADPAGWLRRYAIALTHAWSEVEPLWRRARVLLDREVQRVDAAAERGRFADLIAATGSTSGAAPRALAVSAAQRISVCPTLAGHRSTVVSINHRGLTTALFYPIAEASRALAGQLPPPAMLEAIVGPVRAAVLERLDRPYTVARVAKSLSMSPAAIGRQIKRLERAGLVAHSRADEGDIIERTACGTLLLSLYDGS